MHDGFKVNESVCIAKFEQHCFKTIMKIFENEPKSWWLDEKTFYYYMSHVAITPYLLCFFSKYFLHHQQNRYVGVAKYAILIC